VIGWLSLSFVIALGLAVAPIFSVEVVVITLATTTSIPWMLLGAAVAIGEITGKSLYYLAARGTIRLPTPLHNRLRAQHAPGARRRKLRAGSNRVRTWFHNLRERCIRHPYWMGGTYGISAILGMPPFMATTVFAGAMRMRPSVFLTTGVTGRFVRYSSLAAAPALVSTWLPL